MEIPTDLKIVPLESIPKGQLCSLDLPKIYKLALLMEEMCKKENGIGLSAVQIGLPLNLFVLNYDYFSTREDYHYFVNCEYTPLSSEKENGIEGCLSIKGKNGEVRYFEVDRFTQIKVKGKELLVEPTLQLVDIDLEPKSDDFMRVVFQHEIDHAHQVTIDQIGKEVYIWRK